MYHKIAQLILTPFKNSTTCDVFVAQPDSVKESLAGKLFAIIEIESTHRENLKVTNFLIDNINHNYYQNEKILLREKISTLKVDHIFEAAIAKTNKNFNDFLEKEKIKIDFNKINITVGVVHENRLLFVSSGKNRVLLAHKKPKVDEKDTGNEFIITDIAKQAAVNSSEKSIKLFDNVVSGGIPAKGIFLLTNEALPEYISNKKYIIKYKLICVLPWNYYQKNQPRSSGVNHGANRNSKSKRFYFKPK